MNENENIYELFQRITSIDVQSLLLDFASFIQNQYPNITSYYSGTVRTPDADSFFNLDSLIVRFHDLIDLISLNKNSFDNVQDWVLVEQLEQCQTKLSTISNISKYLRSSIVKGNFQSSVVQDYPLQYNQTLENVSEDLANQNQSEGWTDIAINNDLQEEDYSPEGGNLLKVVFNNSVQLSYMSSVVDNIIGKAAYGKDISAQISFVGDDLNVLEYVDTIKQSISIKINLKMGDIPQFPSYGIDQKMSVGSAIGSFSFPMIFRKLSDIFSTDDSISAFAFKDVKIVSDAAIIIYEVNTRYNQIINGEINI